MRSTQVNFKMTDHNIRTSKSDLRHQISNSTFGIYGAEG